MTHIVEKYAIITDIDLFLAWEHTLCLKLHYKVTTVGPESTTKEIDFCIFWIDYHRLPIQGIPHEKSIYMICKMALSLSLRKSAQKSSTS